MENNTTHTITQFKSERMLSVTEVYTCSGRHSCKSRKRFQNNYQTGIVLINIFLCMFAVLEPAESKEIKIGLLIPSTGLNPFGEESFRTATYMNQRLNSDSTLEHTRINGYQYSFFSRNTDCHDGKGLYDFIDMTVNESNKMDVIIGPFCDGICKTSGLFASQRNISVISYGCMLNSLSNKMHYTTFFRTSESYSSIKKFIISLIEYYHWTRIVIVTMKKGGGTAWADMTVDLWNEVRNDYKANVWQINFTDFETEMKIRAQKFYIYILHLYPKNVEKFLQRVVDLGFFTANYSYITIDYANMANRLSVTGSLNTAFTGLLDITTTVPMQNKIYNDFLQNVVRNNISQRNDKCSHYEYGIRAALLADAFWLLALGVERALSKNSMAMSSLHQFFVNITFEGISGNVLISDDGDRHAELLLNNLVNGCYTPVAVSRTDWQKNTLSFEKLNATIIWPGGATIYPGGYDECVDCYETPSLTNVYLSTGICILVIAILLIAMVYFLRWDKRRKIAKGSDPNKWLITCDELYASPALVGKVGELTGSLEPSNRSKSPRNMVPASSTAVVTGETLRTASLGHTFTKVAMIDGQLVAIKPVKKETVSVTKDIINELTLLRKLRHQNVNPFIGACVDEGSVSLVWMYCHKGSLNLILINDKIKLDWVFKMSFIADVAKGMAYIHESPVGIHGQLKSSNVVVDSNWCCKVTDISAPLFRAGEIIELDQHQLNYSLLWTAPERLRDPTLPPTKKADVYSFAIIIQEILTRTGPFGEMIEPVEVIIQRVRDNEKPQFRPHVNRIQENESVFDLMEICWEEEAYFRPPFNIICDSLKEIRVALGTGTNLVDQMIHMLSDHADQLEELVVKRTYELEQEQMRSENLICRMLPKSVAQSLKNGHAVEPESFSAVTMFFSDIVGFTSLASQSTPLEVVDLLNDLYTRFDTIIGKYDVYKIETIGDAYVLVSGVPVRNGDRHAGEIATVALHLRASVLVFKIRHRPQHQLQLRIGIHTGPVVAGVVGLKMPRYCLFGDTVNYANRMESTGEALKIHVSLECKKYLDLLGGFNLVERGEVHIQDKGMVRTFFLLGKEGFTGQ